MACVYTVFVSLQTRVFASHKKNGLSVTMLSMMYMGYCYCLML